VASSPAAESSGDADAAGDLGRAETAAGAQQPAAESTAPKPQAPAVPATKEALIAALKAKNPRFGGELGVYADARGILALEVHDPAIEDISVLAGLSLVQVDLSGTHVSDLGVLRGMPIQVLYLENTGVKDLGPLAGMPLQSLYLNNTPVDDVGPLEGAPLVELNLFRTKVKDLGPLRRCRLKMVWLNDTPVEDIAPLATNPLVSLTLAGTRVSDLSPLKGHPTLERLHVAETEVTDLALLKFLPGLTRLVFTPNRIEKGIEQARRLPAVREIGTSFGVPEEENRIWPPAVFWQKYDAGEFK